VLIGWKNTKHKHTCLTAQSGMQVTQWNIYDWLIDLIFYTTALHIATDQKLPF
jgi:hypothetical protein